MENRERLMNIANALVDVNDDIRLAYNEEDDSTDVNKEAAHFLKYKEKRIGRDIELYAFIGEIDSVIGMLTDFLGEVLLPLKQQDSIPAQAVMDWGFEELEAERWEEWKGLFRKEGK